MAGNKKSLPHVLLSDEVLKSPKINNGSTDTRCDDTFSHHGEVDHLADEVFVAIALIGQDAVKEALVGARVVEGHVEQVNRSVLDVVAPLAPFPVHALVELLVFDHGAGLAVGVDLNGQNTKVRLLCCAVSWQQVCLCLHKSHYRRYIYFHF